MFMEINHSSQIFITRSHFTETDYFSRRLITLSVNRRFSTETNHSSRKNENKGFGLKPVQHESGKIYQS